MSTHQHDANAVALWNYFRSAIDWVKATFPKCRKEMKGVDWGPLYNAFGGKPLDATKLEKQVAALMVDEDVERKAGIYPYCPRRRRTVSKHPRVLPQHEARSL